MGLLPIPDDQLLSWIVFLPITSIFALGAVELFVGRFGIAVWRGSSLLVSLLGFVLVLDAWVRFDSTLGGLQLVVQSSWIPAFGISYFLGIDGISLLMLTLTSFLHPIVFLAAWNEIGVRVREFIVFMMALQTGLLGAFLSLDLFLFYVFFEALLIPFYFLIGIWGGPRRLRATLELVIYGMVGSLLMLAAILVVVHLFYQQTGVLTFDRQLLIDTLIATDGVWWQTQTWLFLAFALAFAIKLGLFPFHTWLPEVQAEAPTAASALIAGGLLELGAYGFVRYAIPLFPAAAHELGPWIVGLALCGVVYGGLVALVQSDLRRLLAYACLSQLGIVVVGLFALNAQGIQGAVLQLLSFGISAGALFLLAGMLYERRGTLEISEFGGLVHVMPTLTTCFGIATLAAIGLPGLSGFVGEFLVLLGAFERSPLWSAIAGSTLILSASYMLWMSRRVFFGPVTLPATLKLQDLTLRERLVGALLILPMIWIGIHPATFYRPLDRTVHELLRSVERRYEPSSPPPDLVDLPDVARLP